MQIYAQQNTVLSTKCEISGIFFSALTTERTLSLDDLTLFIFTKPIKMANFARNYINANLHINESQTIHFFNSRRLRRFRRMR